MRGQTTGHLEQLEFLALAMLFLAPGTPTCAERPIFGMTPLCHDSKGIARPCSSTEARARVQSRERARKSEGKQEVVGGGTPEHSTAPARTRRPLFGMARLCRDSKGAAKPCG